VVVVVAAAVVVVAAAVVVVTMRSLDCGNTGANHPLRFLGCSRSGPECAFRVLATSYAIPSYPGTYTCTYVPMVHVYVHVYVRSIYNWYGLQYGIKGAVMFTDSVFQTCGTYLIFDRLKFSWFFKIILRIRLRCFWKLCSRSFLVG
jgi:hypothetical protein